jgi:hypothetical protein
VWGIEDLDHLFFRCPTSHFIWCWVRDVLGWDSIPSSLNDFLTRVVGTLGRACNRVLVFLLAGITWATWKTRNDLVFSNKLLPSPNVLAHKIVGFLQHWSKMKAARGLVERERLLGKM